VAVHFSFNMTRGKQSRKRKEGRERKQREEQEKKRKEEQEEKRVQQATAAASTSKQEMSDVQLLDSVQMETKVDITSLFWMLRKFLCVIQFMCGLVCLLVTYFILTCAEGGSGHYIWNICHPWPNYIVLSCIENAFPVSANKDVTIGELKKTIKVLLLGMFANVDTKDLVMWRVNILKDNEEKIEQLQNNEKTIEESGGIKIKHMTKQVGEMFGTPALGSIHIIVECPSK